MMQNSWMNTGVQGGTKQVIKSTKPTKVIKIVKQKKNEMKNDIKIKNTIKNVLSKNKKQNQNIKLPLNQNTTKKRGRKSKKKTVNLITLSTKADINVEIYKLKDLCSLKASEAFEWLYHIKPDAIIKNDFDEIVEFTNARDWWERADAIQQCNQTIGSRDQPNIYCYICGLKLDEDNNTPECEHILPVFLGSLLLKLYRSEYKNKMTPELRREFEMEYAWAHRCCNQVKSDTSFLSYEQKKDGFTFDEKNCREVLKEIKKGNKSYCSNLAKKLNSFKNDEKWIKDRLRIINDDKITPISSFLKNKKESMGEGLFYLSVLSNLISSADLSYINIGQRNAHGLNIIQSSPKGEHILKAVVYENITNNVIKILMNNKTINFTRNLVFVNSFLKNIFSNNQKLDFVEKYNLFSFNKLNVQLIHDFVMRSFIIGFIVNSGNETLHNQYEFNHLFRDIYSILVFSNFSGIGEQFRNSRIFGRTNKMNASKIAKSSFTICCYSIIYNNLINLNYDDVYSSYMSEIREQRKIKDVSISEFETLYFSLKKEIKPLFIKLIKDEIMNISKNEPNQNICNVVLHMTNTIIESFISNDISKNIYKEILLETMDNNYILEYMKISENLLKENNMMYIRMEYYKEYPMEYDELLQKHSDNLTLNELEQMGVSGLSRMSEKEITLEEKNSIEDKLSKIFETEILNEPISQNKRYSEDEKMVAINMMDLKNIIEPIEITAKNLTTLKLNTEIYDADGKMNDTGMYLANIVHRIYEGEIQHRAKQLDNIRFSFDLDSNY